ncbi:MAG TPA: ribosome biogenesis GTP-binding protein YihA/YsxC [Chthoniobacterales bacterium]|nr:ribosome biogenesis GTP-binding protein YihA/YsxC [Chthoniobacterales bacterium]
MKINSATFLVSAPDLASCPAHELQEFAFIGRSNVGKSSMVNMLTGRKDLAKVSATPGFTKLINFFTINNAWSLVDLPGYGYAKVAQRHRTEFNQAVADYLQHRPNLRCTFVLIDSRIPPQHMDLEFLGWLSGCGLPFALIFTKSDKLSPKALQASVADFRTNLAEVSEVQPEIFTSSSKLRQGRNEILGFIATRLVEPTG